MLLCVLVMTVAFSSCEKKQSFVPLADEAGWFCAWACAPEAASEDIIPSSPGLRGNTCRQVIRASLGGNKLKLTFSNEFGDIPLVIEKVHIAKLINLGSPAIDLSTDTAVTFGGKEELALDVGKTAVSDEISFEFEDMDNIAVTIKLGDYTGGVITCHQNAKTYSWLCEGDKVGDENLSGIKVMSSWYYLTAMDVWREAGTRTLVAIGDSVTDGVGSTANKYMSWVDQADANLKSNPHTTLTSVVNMGRSGLSLLGTDGSALSERLEKDVFGISGVRYCVIQAGINDIASAQADISDKMIAEYKRLIELCHKKGIRVYGATITPCKGNFIYSELHERIRGAVNRFITSPDSGLDGYIDFSKILASEDDPAAIKDKYLSMNTDYLNPSDNGYEAMAEEAYIKLSDYWLADRLAAESEK